MDKPIMFTPQEFITMFLGVCAAIITISGAIMVIFNFFQKMKSPEKQQNERIQKCEDRLDEIDKRLEVGDNHFADLDEGNRVTQKALLALLKHSINNDDKSSIIEAEKELESYLINKGGMKS